MALLFRTEHEIHGSSVKGFPQVAQAGSPMGRRLLAIIRYEKCCRIGGTLSLDDLAETEIGDWTMPNFSGGLFRRGIAGMADRSGRCADANHGGTAGGLIRKETASRLVAAPIWSSGRSTDRSSELQPTTEPDAPHDRQQDDDPPTKLVAAGVSAKRIQTHDGERRF